MPAGTYSWHLKKSIISAKKPIVNCQEWGKAGEKHKGTSQRFHRFPPNSSEPFRFPNLLYSHSSPPRVGAEILNCSKTQGFGSSTNMGGVNHCRLHCRLAKSRGLMRRGKYGAVIGHKMRIFVCAQCELPGYGFLFSQSQRRIYPSSSNHGISPNDSG